MHNLYIRARAFISNHNVILGNLSYLSVLQIFLLIAPLITYPYLVRVLSRELYGVVLTAQVLANYASILIDFGSNSVCAKHVSINRSDLKKLSEIINSVLVVRSIIFVVCFFIYTIVVFIIPQYRAYFILFLLSYGMVINELLFPQYFFQGIEKMKYITIINIVIRVVFILLVFVFVKTSEDYLFIPVLYTIGYLVGGIISLHIVYKKINLFFYIPTIKVMKVYVKDSLAIFATDFICTIKDKLNYLLVGSFAGMENVVVYDLGSKINGILTKPISIISVSLFPKLAKSRDVKIFKKTIVSTFLLTCFVVLIANIFLPLIIHFFIGDDYSNLLPIRLFTLAPIFLSISVIIYNNFFIAFGYNKYALFSIIFTTIAYVVIFIVLIMTNYLNTLYAFIILILVSYFVELIYRVVVFLKLDKRFL